MAKGKQRDPHKEQLWRQRLQRWQRSGLSIRAFCEQEGCSEPCFYAWRKTITQRDHATRAATPVTFVPLSVPQPLPTPPLLEVVLNNGRILRLPANLPLDTVRRLATALEDASC